jgi:carboxymethylenebutenolidase
MPGGALAVTRVVDVSGSQARLAVPASGSGPGLVLFGGRPELAGLYAEEGYVTLAVPPGAGGATSVLKAQTEVAGKIAAIGFGGGGRAALDAALSAEVACASIYYAPGVGGLHDKAGRNGVPVMFHFADNDAEAFDRLRARFPEVEAFFYRGIAPGFAEPGAAFDKSADSLAYTRSLELLRRTLGPRFDLDKIWDRHTELEFAARAAEETMTTMVAEPNVNHVPVMTGGTGAAELLRFYKHHFIPTTPKDASLVPISRTIGADRAVDEMLFCFTHDIEIDWMLPGIAPTGKYVQIPLVAIVQFRGDKLVSEHIYWDQASVLVQIGLLDPKLYPAAGVETAKKAFDENLPSNTLMARWRESEDRAGA